MILRKAFFQIMALSSFILMTSCGEHFSQSKPKAKNFRTMEKARAAAEKSAKEMNDKTWVFTSEQGKEIRFIFSAKDNSTITREKSEKGFPVGGVEAQLYSYDDDVEIASATYSTCCNKTFPVAFKKVNKRVWKLENFSLDNERFAMNIKFTNQDEVNVVKVKAEEKEQA